MSAAVRDVTDRLEAQAERERLMAQAERERLEARSTSRSAWRASASSPAGSPTTSTTCSAVILNYTAFVAEEVAEAADGEERDGGDAVRHDVEQIQRAADGPPR